MIQISVIMFDNTAWMRQAVAVRRLITPSIWAPAA
jgi:hypothetical protein